MADSQVSLTELAERCEKAGGPEFAIDCKIEALIFDNHQGMMRSFTSSIDAAMTLPPEGRAALVLEQAIERCLLAVSHKSGLFLRRLPQFVCAAALRARATQEQSK